MGFILSLKFYTNFTDNHRDQQVYINLILKYKLLENQRSTLLIQKSKKNQFIKITILLSKQFRQISTFNPYQLASTSSLQLKQKQLRIVKMLHYFMMIYERYNLEVYIESCKAPLLNISSRKCNSFEICIICPWYSFKNFAFLYKAIQTSICSVKCYNLNNYSIIERYLDKLFQRVHVNRLLLLVFFSM